MPQNFRHPEILDIARRDGRVLVENLASRFGVTVQTIRRDLKELSNAGQLERVHGGAVIALGARNIAYEARRQLNAPAKVAMARKVATLLDRPAAFMKFACSRLGVSCRTENSTSPPISERPSLAIPVLRAIDSDPTTAMALTPSIRQARNILNP